MWLNNFGERIGEYVPRYFMLMRNLEESSDKYLNVMFDSNYELGNKALSKIISRYVTVCNTENKRRWVYILSKLSKFHKVDYSKYFSLCIRCNDERIYTAEWTKNKLLLSDEEIRCCKQKMTEMGLNEPYVCIFNRDSAYLNRLYPNVDWSYHDYRDSSITTRYPMIEYLGKKGIQTVRVGKDAVERCIHENCIDYTNDYRDDLMDIFLHTKAKFIVGDNTGLNIIPISTNGCYVCTNLCPTFFATYNGYPNTFNGLIIFKRLFDVNRNKFLSLEEMAVVEEKARADAGKYAELGLRFIDNSPQEILEAAEEMNARIDGTWIETDEDKMRQKKFNDFRHKIEERYELAESDNLHVRIGARFLEQNWEIFGLDG